MSSSFSSLGRPRREAEKLCKVRFGIQALAWYLPINGIQSPKDPLPRLSGQCAERESLLTLM